MTKMLSKAANTYLKIRMFSKFLKKLIITFLVLQVCVIAGYNLWLNPYWDRSYAASQKTLEVVWMLLKNFEYKTAFHAFGNMSDVMYEVIKISFEKSFFTWLGFPIVILYFVLFDEDKSNRNEYVRGKKALPPDELNKEAHKKNSLDIFWYFRLKNCIPLGNVYLPIKEENKQCFMAGKPGSGKTNAFNQILLKIRNRKQKCIIHDYKGDYVETFYNPEDSLLFNPLDQRSLGWCLFNDCKTVMDIEAFAGALIPEAAPGSEPFWNNAARDIFVGLLRYCFANNKRTNADIWEVAILPRHKMYNILKDTKGGEKGAAYLATETPTVGSILSNLIQYVKVFEYLAPMHGDFSIRKWVEDKNEHKTIFVTNYIHLKNTLNPAIALFIQTVGNTLMSQTDNIDNRLFFLLDEFGQMQPLSTIVDLMTASRSKGGSVFIGIQDIGRVDKLYKKETRETILNSASNRVVFNLRDMKECEFFSNDFGKTEYYRAIESQSLAMTDSDRITTSRQLIKEPIIFPEEVQSLPDLHAFITIGHYNPTMSIWKYKKLKKQTVAFVQRPELDLTYAEDIVPFDATQKPDALDLDNMGIKIEKPDIIKEVNHEEIGVSISVKDVSMGGKF